MTQFKLLSVLLLLTIAATVARADSESLQSEYLHQTDGGAFDLTPGIGMAPGDTVLLRTLPGGAFFRRTSFNDSPVKNNFTLIPIAVGGEYGINSAYSIGTQLAYVSGGVSIENCPLGSNCRTKRLSGLADPVVYFKGRNSVGNGTIHYGLVGSFALANEKTDASGDANLATGGMALTPFVAYQMPTWAGAWGARFSYGIWVGDRRGSDDSVTPSTSSRTSGGNTWVLDTFLEAPVGITTLGGAIFYRSNADSKTSVNGAPAHRDDSQSTVLGFEFYSPVHLAKVTLLPSLVYQQYKVADSAKVSSDESVQIAFASRFTF